MIRLPGRQRLEQHLAGIPGIVGCWPMDESSGGVYRDVIRANHAAVTNGRTLTRGPLEGGPPTASLLPASNQYGLVANAALLRPASVTLMAWINPNASAADRGVAGVADTGFTGYNLRVDAGTSKWRVGNGTSTATTVIGSALGVAGTAWRFVAGTADGANAVLYLDGDMDPASAPTAAAFPVGYGATVAFCLGQWDGNATRSHAGGIGYVAVANRAMTAGEVMAVHHAWKGA